MDVRIGVTFSPRELEIELPDDADAAAVKDAVEAAVAGGTGILWFTDRKGHQVGVQADKLTYIDIGTGNHKGRIGFGG